MKTIIILLLFATPIFATEPPKKAPLFGLGQECVNGQCAMPTSFQPTSTFGLATRTRTVTRSRPVIRAAPVVFSEPVYSQQACQTVGTIVETPACVAAPVCVSTPVCVAAPVVYEMDQPVCVSATVAQPVYEIVQTIRTRRRLGSRIQAWRTRAFQRRFQAASNMCE